MFDDLSTKLQSTFRNLTGRGILTEKNIDDAMTDVRRALLEADVNIQVVRDFVSTVRTECLGERVVRSIQPGQQAIKVVNDRLVELMGDANVPLAIQGAPATIMMVGLHGGGKTTTSGKLAGYLKREGKRVLLVGCDLYRPAAIDQLEALGKQLGVEVFTNRQTKDVTAVAMSARDQARKMGADVMILDTAGRLHIDQPLIQELVRLKATIQPSEILLVGDAALGQEAVAIAEHFNEALQVTGIVLTKLDGDARGGAALSMRKVTGRPIKFIGVGEKLEDLEPFHPDRMATRILGMGDVVTLVERAAEKISEEEAQKLEDKMLRNQFDLEDFMSLMQQLKRLGGMGQILGMIPGGQQLLANADMGDKMLGQCEAMISSMTPHERAHPECFSEGSRLRRVARGSGHQDADVIGVLQRFQMMRGMMNKTAFGKMAQMLGFGGVGGVGGLPGFADDFGPGGDSGGFGFPSQGDKTQVSQKDKKAKRKKNKKGGRRKKR